MELTINYKFPVATAYSKEAIQQNFWKCLYTASDDKALHYWVFLPKHLKPTEVKPEMMANTGLTNIGRNFTVDKSPYMEVWAAYEHCPWEMNASDWPLSTRLTMLIPV